RSARQDGLEDIAVKICNLGPCLKHLCPQKVGMALVGKRRIGIVIKHDAVGAPQHDDGHRRTQRNCDARLEVAGPSRDGTKGRCGPIECAYEGGKLAAPPKETRIFNNLIVHSQSFEAVALAMAVSSN